MKKSFSNPKFFSIRFILLLVVGALATIETKAQCPEVPVAEAVKNGNFEAGYTADPNNANYFYTDYTRFTPGAGKYSNPGDFFMGKVSAPFNPGSFDGAVDHTTGAGTFYMVDGDRTVNRIVWRQEVEVQPDQTYYFSAWVSTLYKSETSGTVAQLQFAINGTPIGPIFAPSLSFNVWNQFFQTYRTGQFETTLTISIVNQRTGILTGNDFAIDDISFINGCQNVTAGVNPNLGDPISICTNGDITISSSTSLAGSNRIYWKNLTTDEDLVASYDQPTITVSQPGRYQICVEKDNCLRTAVKEVTTACPIPKLGPDISACSQAELSNVTLTASTPAYNTNAVNFTWYYRATSNGNFAPITGVGNSNTYKPTLGTGEYKVDVVSTHPACPSCEVASDTVKIDQPTPSFAYSNNTFCTSSDNLVFSVTDPAGYVGQYDWFTTLTGGSPIATNTTSVTRTKSQLAPTVVGVDSTYFLYVEDVKLKTATVAATTVTTGFGGSSSTSNRVYFDVAQKVTINSVQVTFIRNYVGPGATPVTYTNLNVSIFNSSGTPLITVPFSVVVGPGNFGNTPVQTITLNQTVDVGTGYYMNVSGSDLTGGKLQMSYFQAAPGPTFFGASSGQLAGYVTVKNGTQSDGTGFVTFTSPQIANWQLSASGNYPCGRVRVAVTKKCPCTVPTVTLTSSTNSTTLCGSSNLTLTASAQPASSNYAYEWFRNNTKIIGSTDSTLLVSSTLGTSGYRAKVTNIVGSCFGTSSIQTITVLQNVANNVLGAGDTICQGSTAKTIGTTAAQNSTGYAWLSSTLSENSGYTTLAGITTQTISVSPTVTTYYKRIALNACKNDTSSAYIVLVDPSLTLAAIVASDSSLCAGNTSVIGTLTPTGGITSALNYEWQFSSNGTIWSPSIDGATNNTYTTPNLTSSTYYRGIVKSLKCSATSNAVLVKVTQPVVSSSNNISANQLVCSGIAPATLTGSTVTGGVQPTTYLWLQSTDNTTWSDASGTNNTNNYSPSALNTTTYFRRVITSTGPCKQDSSASVTINIDNAVVAGSIIANDSSICSGTSPILNNDTLASGGTAPLKYSWQYSFDGIDWFDINSNNASLNTAPSITSANQYRRIATSSASTCADTTNSFKVDVKGIVNAGSVFAPLTKLCSGQAPGIITSNTPASNGTSNLPNYQWQYLNNGVWTDLLGETADNYSPSAVTSDISFRRRAVFGSATCDTAYTSPVEITLYTKQNPGSIESGSTTICVGSAYTVKSSALPSGGSPNKLFTWNISNVPYTTWRDTLVDVGNSDLTISNVTQNTRVRRIATDDCGNDTTNVFEIFVQPKATPDINFKSPTPGTLCASNNLTLSVDTLDAGKNALINWVYNNVLYSNQGTSFNVPKPLIDGAIVKAYLVVDPNILCSTPGDSTNEYTLSIKQPISNNSISGDQTKCFGSPFSKISGTKVSGDTATSPYSWQSSTDKFNWNPTTTTSVDYDPGNPNETTYFRRLVSSSGICGNDTSNFVTISVQPIVYNGKIAALDATRCSGDTLVIESINDPLGGNGSFTFSWIMSTDGSNPNAWTPILNEFKKDLRIAKDKLDPTKSKFFFKRNIVSGICENGDTTSVVICQKPVIGSNPALSPICSNRGSLETSPADSLIFAVIKTNNPRQLDDDYSPSGEPLVVSFTNPFVYSPKNGQSILLRPDGVATFTYKPNANFVGKDTVGFNLCSSTNQNSCSVKYFYITVIRKNNAPTFKGEAYSVYRNQEVSGNILNNDSDLENDTLYVYPSELTTPTNAEFKLPKYGTISMSSNGDFTYVPNKDIGKGGEIKDTAIFFVSEFSKRPSKYCNKLFSYLDTVVITIKPYRIFVPEGFSPNNDGVNDFFVISSEVPLKMELSIYNRWGNLVYENKDYKNDWNGIPNKGLIVGGEGVPDGTYYIYYNVNEKEQEDFKYITISR